jgi:DNA recombination protein RmuC
MGEILPVSLLLIGLAVGGGAVWLLMRAKIEHALQRGKGEAEAERVALATTLEQERKQSREKLGVLDEAQRKLSDAFKALAAEALKSNNQQFLELAKTKLETFQQSAKGDLDKRQEAIGNLVTPVKESLEKVDEKIRALEQAREGAYRGLREQVGSLVDSQKELRTETSNLVKALRRPEIRGRWGEIQLRRAVELAGMLDHCDFYEQQSAVNIVVDSKAPLDALLDAMEAPDEQTRGQRLTDHVRQVRGHISALGKKSYPEQFAPALDFVVLFLPGEVFFRAALERDPGLIEFGIKEKVVIASPTTLISLLRAAACGWQQEALAENAKQISDLGKELHKRLSDMGGHLHRLAKSLSSATQAYNQAIGTLELHHVCCSRRNCWPRPIQRTNGPRAGKSKSGLRPCRARFAPLESRCQAANDYLGAGTSPNGPMVTVALRVSGYSDSTSATCSGVMAATSSRSSRTLRYSRR